MRHQAAPPRPEHCRDRRRTAKTTRHSAEMRAEARLHPNHPALRARDDRVTLDEVLKINIRG